MEVHPHSRHTCKGPEACRNLLCLGCGPRAVTAGTLKETEENREHDGWALSTRWAMKVPGGKSVWPVPPLWHSHCWGPSECLFFTHIGHKWRREPEAWGGGIWRGREKEVLSALPPPQDKGSGGSRPQPEDLGICVCSQTGPPQPQSQHQLPREATRPQASTRGFA